MTPAHPGTCALPEHPGGPGHPSAPPAVRTNVPARPRHGADRLHHGPQRPPSPPRPLAPVQESSRAPILARCSHQARAADSNPPAHTTATPSGPDSHTLPGWDKSSAPPWLIWAPCTTVSSDGPNAPSPRSVTPDTRVILAELPA